MYMIAFTLRHLHPRQLVYTDHTAYKGPPVLASGNRTGLIMETEHGLELMERDPKADSSASACVKIPKRTAIRRNVNAQSVSGRNRAAGLVCAFT